MDLDVSHFELTRNVTNTENEKVNASPAKEEYKKELAQTLMQTGAPSNKVRSPGSFVPLTNTMYTTSKDGHAQPFSSFPRHYRAACVAAAGAVVQDQGAAGSPRSTVLAPCPLQPKS